jgi:CRP-like cAMP-binding protein
MVADLTGNRILDALASEDRAWFVEYLSPIALSPPQVLRSSGEDVETIYFPTEGVISLTVPLQDGSFVEAAVIGNEGFLGLHAVAGVSPGHMRAMAQIPGAALEGHVKPLQDLFVRSSGLQWLVSAYSQTIISQIAQSVACNAAHPILERCARWLLQSHDRVRGDEFTLTHEFLSEMLGVTRPSVTVAAGVLQEAGLISYRRGNLKVLDRAGLEAAACECYQAIVDEYERLMRIPS